MYALVLWLEAQQFSVLPDGDIRGDGDKEAKWGDGYYSVKVVMRSMNKEWLESLRVTVDGEIIPDGDSVAQSQELMIKRVSDRKTQNAAKKTLAASKKAYQDRVLRSSTIFEIGKNSFDEPPNSKEPDEDETVEKSGTETSNAFPARAGSNGPDSTERNPAGMQGILDGTQDDFGGTEDSSNGIQGGSGGLQDTSDRIQQDSNACLCSNFPKVTSEDVNLLTKMLNLARSILSRAQFEEVPSTEQAQEPAKTSLSKTKNIPLFEGSAIRLPAWKLAVIIDTYRKNARGMVRKLMVEILGKEKLKKSSPTGKGGWTPIPADTFDDVEMFVQNNVRKKYRLTHDEYMKCLTAQCATLRNPKPPTGSKTVKGFKVNRKTVMIDKNDMKQKKIESQKTNEPVENDKIGHEKRKVLHKFHSKRALADPEGGTTEDEEEKPCENDGEDSLRNSIVYGEASSSDSEDPSDEEIASGDDSCSQTGKDGIQVLEGGRKKGGENRQPSRFRMEEQRQDSTRQNDSISTEDGVPVTSSTGIAQALLDSTQKIFRESTLHSSTSSTEVQTATINSTPEESNIHKRGDSVPLSSKNLPPKDNNSKRPSKASDIGRTSRSKRDEKLPSDGSECNLQELGNRESEYLVRIKELEMMLAEKSNQNDIKITGKKGLRTKKSSGEKKRKSNDDDLPILKKKLKT
ncbi:hypothetical protein QAD02_019539 [Eretmocerus hayati]|uniref:Uncharacterized protein n=1 Tax=Eretmocerus hayati TaxID=131215 RepID=A0ACC2PJV6_9HYME|nr:hypothetical protein QAD02_019539 [Eretmocerus hayati]